MAELPLSIDDLWIGEMRGVTLEREPLLVVRTEDGVRVFRDRCPHQGYPLSEGELHAGVITCRLHRHTFDAATGAGINPPAPCLAAVPSQVERGRVVVELAATKAAP
ncbi:MAG: rieske domain protein [Polyangiaceae bacterium]|jgi:toluene monooxygenase system ferredoxin subunit|nr:rieske domain protein [Polyangiaceae bacterium]